MPDTTPGLYGAAVRRRFANPAHAGDLPVGYACTALGEARDPASGFSVVIAAAADGGILRAMRFRAFGCPHLIAAAEAACEELEGRPVAALPELQAAALMEQLQVPAGKTGRILLIEDALRALAAALRETDAGVAG